ncbi:MAG: cytidylate kinase-like family protein [Clostridiales bacterium]|jgi:cytidylate kinase|nr:cytidylate kinase-like family protein [Clostridiales bacterium]
MEKKVILTIGRQFGSGGAEIGKKLAKELNIPFYDKEILTEAAKKSGYSEDLFTQRDEKKTGSLLFSLSTGAYPMGGPLSYLYDLPLDDRLFLAQIDAMKHITQRGSCIIVGRCAEYILRDDPGCISVFIHAALEKRVERISRIYELSPQKAENLIVKTDKRRAQYHNYYSTEKWGDATAYHMCVDSGALGVDQSVELIRRLVDLSQK